MVGYFRAARVSNSSGEGMGALRREEKPVAAWREDVDTISSFGQSESGPRRHIVIWHVDWQGHYLAERTACSSGVTARVFWAAAVNGQWRFLQTRLLTGEEARDPGYAFQRIACCFSTFRITVVSSPLAVFIENIRLLAAMHKGSATLDGEIRPAPRQLDHRLGSAHHCGRRARHYDLSRDGSNVADL